MYIKKKINMAHIVKVIKEGVMYNVLVRNDIVGTQFVRYGSLNKIAALAYAFGYCDAVDGDVELIDDCL